MVTTTILLRLYDRSTACHSSHTSRAADPLAAVTLTYLFT